MRRAILLPVLVCLTACKSGVEHPEARARPVLSVGMLTLADGEAIRAALLERLQGSELEDREELLAVTRGASARIDEQGVYRIGVWILKPHDGELQLMHRGAFGPRAAKLHTARVTRAADQWEVGEVTPGQIWLRR